MYGACSRLPNLIQSLVVTLKRATIGQIAHNRYGTNLLEVQLAVVVQKVDAHEAEARISPLSYAQPGECGLKVADGVVVRSAIFAVNLAHSLTCRLAITHAYAYRSMVCGHTRYNLQASVQLTSEVQKDRGVLGSGTLHHADVAVGKVCLTVALAQEVLYVADILAVLGPYDACWRDVLAHEFARMLALRMLGIRRDAADSEAYDTASNDNN